MSRYLITGDGSIHELNMFILSKEWGITVFFIVTVDGRYRI